MQQSSEPSTDASPDVHKEALPPTGWHSTFYALRYRNFRILWLTSGLVSSGVWLQQVTLSWLAYELTHDALQVGTILGMRTAPLLLAPLTGVLVDRMDRRKLLMIDQFLVTALIFGFSALLFTGKEQVWHLYVFALLFGLLWAVNNPVRQTLVANSVPREALMNAMALNAVAFNSMRMLGPAIGGVLIVLVGPALNFFIQGLLFSSVILMLTRYKAEYGTDGTALARKTSPVKSLIEGFRYVLSDRRTLLVITMTFLAAVTLLGSVFNLLSVYVAEVLDNENGDLLGLLMTALGVGGVFGTFLIARFSTFPRKGLQTIVAFTGAALAVIALGLVDNFIIALLVLAFYQVFAQGVMTTNMTMVQSLAPDNLRGRVVGVYQVEIGLMPLGGIIGGAIANRWGVDVSFLVAGVTALGVIALITLFSPSIRNLRA